MTCSAWPNSPWSELQEIVCLLCCDVRDARLQVSETELFQHRHGEHYQRRLKMYQDKVAEREAVLRRVYSTRHCTPNAS